MRRHFTKDIQMANKHMKRCSTLLAMREMQIKTTMKYHYTPIRMIKIKNNENAKKLAGCGETRWFIRCWWNCSATLENNLVVSLKKESNYHTTLLLHTWAFIQRNEDLCSHTNLYKSIYSSFVHNNCKLETTQMSFNW